MEIILILAAFVASPFIVKAVDKPTRERIKAIGRSNRNKALGLPAPPKRDRSADQAYHKLWDDAFLWLTLSGVAVDFVAEKQWREERSGWRTRERYVQAPKYNDYHNGLSDHFIGYSEDEEKYYLEERLRADKRYKDAQKAHSQNLERARQIDKKYALMEKYGVDIYKNDVMAIASIKN